MNSNKWLWFLILIILSGAESHLVFADHKEVHLVDGKHEYEVYSDIEIFEDKSGTETIDSISNDQFKKYNKKSAPSYGYQNSVYWVRLNLQNVSNVEEWILEIMYPPLDQVTLFTSTGDGTFSSQLNGDEYPFSKRDIQHRNIIFPFSIKTDESKELYLRIETEGAMKIPVKLWTESSFHEKHAKEYFWFGSFYGFILILALYNFFLFISLRERSYLYYVIYNLAMLMVQFSLFGFSFQFLWQDLIWWNNIAIVFFMCLSNSFSSLFVKQFLKTKQFMPRMNKILNFIIGISLLTIPINFLHYKLALNLISFITIAMLLIIMVITILSLKKGVRTARFLLAAWSFLLVGSLVTSLEDAGLLVTNFFTMHAIQFGSGIEMILLSFALADRIQLMQKEKEVAEREARKNHQLAIESLQNVDELKDEILANTSHEFRTPLHGIIGMGEALLAGSGGVLSTRVKDQLEIIVTSGNRLLLLVNDILDFSKIKFSHITLEPKPVQLESAVNVVFSICDPIIQQKALTVKSEIKVDLPYVFADENRLQQLLYNLIGNVIKFTDGRTIRVTASEKQGYIEIHIIDSGRGIDQMDLQSMFTKFEKVEPNNGIGLGLSISKMLVELHGGRIWVCTSKEGTETTIAFTLPIFQELDELKAITEQSKDQFGEVYIPIEEPRIGSILVIDDDEINLQILQSQLGLAGYSVVTAQDGHNVLEELKVEEFDLVILDIMLPVISGYQICGLIREQYSIMELPVLMLTAKGQPENIETAFRLGANDYVLKPCHQAELLARVETLITLKQKVKEVQLKSIDLEHLNKRLLVLNNELEERVETRTLELQQKNIELLEVNQKLKKMEESRKELLSMISHELRTPLTSIKGYSKAFLDGVIQEDHHEYYKLIYEKSEHLNRLIEDLFELSKVEMRQLQFYFQHVSLNEFLGHMFDSNYLWVTEEGIDFELDNHLSQATYYIDVDVDRLEQVFSNLITNAIKHTSSGEMIKITCEQVMREEALVQQKNDGAEAASTIEHNQTYALIRISDTGTGIADDELDKLFDRFYRGKSSNKAGTGLGLAITKGIIECHHGLIWVESEEGKGTTFSFILPVYGD